MLLSFLFCRRLLLQRQWLAQCSSWVAGLAIALSLAQPANSQNYEVLNLLTVPVELGYLNPAAIPEGGAISTDQTISQTELTIPSLWWAREQFGSKLLEHWIAYNEAEGVLRRVDLVVNQQVWNSLDYIDRYAFLSQMGTVARDFGFNTRVFNQDQELLGVYYCAIAPSISTAPSLSITPPDPSTIDSCNIFLGSVTAGALEVTPGALGEY